LPEAAQKAMVANREAVAIYTGHRMSDPGLAERLGTLELPTLVLWGESERVADPEYGRAFAASIPMARFRILAGAGHLLQLEKPTETGAAIWDCVGTDFNGGPS
jgi:pimeloyl-ACP methyl ester carboxylesterase